MLIEVKEKRVGKKSTPYRVQKNGTGAAIMIPPETGIKLGDLVDFYRAKGGVYLRKVGHIPQRQEE